jgi:hypothetical protein
MAGKSDNFCCFLKALEAWRDYPTNALDDETPSHSLRVLNTELWERASPKPPLKGLCIEAQADVCFYEQESCDRGQSLH